MELVGLMLTGLIVGAGVGFCAACTLARKGMIEGVYTKSLDIKDIPIVKCTCQHCQRNTVVPQSTVREII